MTGYVSCSCSRSRGDRRTGYFAGHLQSTSVRVAGKAPVVTQLQNNGSTTLTCNGKEYYTPGSHFFLETGGIGICFVSTPIPPPPKKKIKRSQHCTCFARSACNATGGSGCSKLCLLVLQTILERREKDIVVCSSGMLPGNAFSINNHGLAITGNIVNPNRIFTKGRIGTPHIHFGSHCSYEHSSVLESVRCGLLFRKTFIPTEIIFSETASVQSCGSCKEYQQRSEDHEEVARWENRPMFSSIFWGCWPQHTPAEIGNFMQRMKTM